MLKPTAPFVLAWLACAAPCAAQTPADTNDAEQTAVGADKCAARKSLVHGRRGANDLFNRSPSSGP